MPALSRSTSRVRSAADLLPVQVAIDAPGPPEFPDFDGPAIELREAYSYWRARMDIYFPTEPHPEIERRIWEAIGYSRRPYAPIEGSAGLICFDVEDNSFRSRELMSKVAGYVLDMVPGTRIPRAEIMWEKRTSDLQRQRDKKNLRSV